MPYKFLHSTKFFKGLLFLCFVSIIVLIIINAGKSSLEQIHESKKLTILTRNAPTTYYEGLDGKTGFEYELCKLFAEFLGAELQIIVPDNFSNIIPMINGGQADLAAAGLTITESRKGLVRFGPPYQEIRQQLIYKAGKGKSPETIEDIIGGQLEVVAGSSFEERLKELKLQYPDLTWRTNQELDTDQLLLMVAEDVIDYTIIDSNEFEFNRRFYPELRIAFDISEPQQLAWVFRQGSSDDALHESAVQFFAQIEENGTLTHMLEKHYGYARKFKPVETTEFLRHAETRLPEYRSMFEEAGQRYGFDWRLLAAISYQESHWITDAVSPTGVRGIMMLTTRTAGQLGVRNRLDARESIMAGASYLQLLKNQLPESITEPDRIWMAMASYNVGLMHLEDAREITRSHEKNPDRWLDVKQYLPLLAKKKWYAKTKYGYARGWEPVIYVRNIRSYYDILLWLDERKQKKAQTVAPPDPRTILPQSL